MPPAPPDPSLQPLEACYRSQRAALRGYFLRCGVRPEWAADLVQDTFARAVRAWPAFRGQSSLSTWVHAIARAAMADHFRSLGRSPEDRAFSLDDLDPAGQGLMTQPLGRPSGDDADTMAASLALRRALVRFAQAHPQRAEVLHLVAVNDWSNAELGQWLGRTPHAAAEYLSQCRRLLRDTLRAEWPQCGEA